MPPAPRDRQRELEFLRTHSLEEYAGEIIVLDGDEIVAHGHDGKQLVEAARNRGIDVPFLHLVDLNCGQEGVRMGL